MKGRSSVLICSSLKLPSFRRVSPCGFTNVVLSTSLVSKIADFLFTSVCKLDDTFLINNNKKKQNMNLTYAEKKGPGWSLRPKKLRK